MLSLCLYVYLPFPSPCQGFRSLVSILFLPVHWGSFSFCLKRGFHEAFFHEALLVIYPLFFSQNIFILHSGFKGLSKWLSGKESACQCRRCRRLGFNPCVRKISWSSKWQPTPVFLPGTFQGQGSLVGCSPYGRRESDMTEQLHTHTHTHTQRTVGPFYWIQNSGLVGSALLMLMMLTPFILSGLLPRICWGVVCQSHSCSSKGNVSYVPLRFPLFSAFLS